MKLHEKRSGDRMVLRKAGDVSATLCLEDEVMGDFYFSTLPLLLLPTLIV
jgi:hypothetical protein